MGKYRVMIAVDINADCAENAAKGMVKFLQRNDLLWGEVFEYKEEDGGIFGLESCMIFRYPDFLLENGEKA